MMKLPLSLLALFHLSHAQVPTQAPTSSRTISQILADRLDTSILALALNISSYNNIWDADRKRTVFAPTNEAFLNAPVNMTKYMTEEWGRTHLWSLFKYSSTMREQLSSDWMDGDIMVNFEGGNLTVAEEDDGSFLINNSTVEEVDIDATNGVIHLMEDILLPDWATTTLADVIMETPQLTQLAEALTESDWAFLEDPDNGPFTLFAPTSLRGYDANADLLNYHLVPGMITRLSPGDEYTTVQKTTIEIATRSGSTTLVYTTPDGDTIARMDSGTIDENAAVLASNGVVHPVNVVLMP